MSMSIKHIGCNDPHCDQCNPMILTAPTPIPNMITPRSVTLEDYNRLKERLTSSQGVWVNPQPMPPLTADEVIMQNISPGGQGIPSVNKELWSILLGSDVSTYPLSKGIGFEHNLLAAPELLDEGEGYFIRLDWNTPIIGETKSATWDITQEDLDKPSACLPLVYIALPMSVSNSDAYTAVMKELMMQTREYKAQIELDRIQAEKDNELMDKVDDILEGVL